MEATTVVASVLGTLLCAGVLVLIGFYIAQKASVLGRSDLTAVLKDMRSDAQKDRKAARDDLRYVVNLLSAKDPMAVQQLESISTISNPQETPEPITAGSFPDMGDFAEAQQEAERLGINIPGPML